MTQILPNHSSMRYSYSVKPGAPVLLLSNSLGTDFSMWDKQFPAFSKHFSVLRYNNDRAAKNENNDEDSMTLLGKDVIELLNYLSIDTVIFCGLSMGGLVGQWLGINNPERLSKLIICNTSAKIGTENGWNERIEQVKTEGLIGLAEASANRWFTRSFREKQTHDVTRIIEAFKKANPASYAFCCAAIRDTNFKEKINGIKTKTLIVAGSEDTVTTVEDGNYFLEKIINASMTILKASHLSNVEASEEFTEVVINFIKEKT